MVKGSKEIKVKWECVEATPEETGNRLNKAFDILFDEVLNKEKEDYTSALSLTKYGKPKF